MRTPSIRSLRSEDLGGGLLTARFKHIVTEGGHAVITGRDGETLQRCEDEPIHIPGAIQGFGLLIAFEEQSEGKLIVRVVSENSKRIIGFTPKQLFSLDSFTDILSEEQADNLLDHVDFIRDEDADVITNGPEVFTMAIRSPQRKNQKLWCAMHINDANPNLVICEFELEDDQINPLVQPNDMTPELPEDTLESKPTEEEYQESTQNSSKPLRVLRSARKRKGEAAAMEVFNIMSQVQEQLAAAPNLEKFLKVLVGVVKELTGFHRVMVYQFDQAFNGRVVTELVDPRATKDLYKGLNFPASDIPKQARELYKINKVRMLYDRDHDTARLVCRTLEDLETPLDLTHSYLRAMSPIHLKYLANMAVRSSMSISINAFNELWGLIACHSYGSRGMRVSFPIRKMCRLVGDSASRNIERLSYASRLQARKLINTVPTQSNPSGYIIASSEDLLKLFDADFGVLSIRDETKILGHIEQSQEVLAMLEYLRMRSVTSVMTSVDVKEDFPDLRYPPGFQVVAGLLLVPLSAGGQDFIAFFRKGQLKEVKWAGNPYEKFIKEGTEGYLEPRKSFRTWSETVVGKCRDWTEEEIETAAVLCLVYGKFIEVWRQKEAALQNSQLTRLLLANSAHEVRTPLNAIINYLEIALEGTLDQETRENLAKSHSASKSLIYVINDLLDLTKTEEGGDLVKDEVFDLKAMLLEATDAFKGDAKRKNIEYEIIDRPGLPQAVIGDQRRVRQAISNITANAIQNTIQGGVTVEMYLTSREATRCELEVSVTDTGAGMNSKKLDQLFRELEQVQSEGESNIDDAIAPTQNSRPEAKKPEERTLGLGLALVARIIRNMNGQLRLKSEEGKGSRFVIQFPFDLPDTEAQQPPSIEDESTTGSITPHAELQSGGPTTPGSLNNDGEVTLVERGSANRRSSMDRPILSRKSSGGSVNSRRSVTGSVKSGHSNFSFSSNRSGKSEADRLIEAIQEPHRLEGSQENAVVRSGSLRAGGSLGAASPGPISRPKMGKRHTLTTDASGSPIRSPTKSPDGIDKQPVAPLEQPGQALVTDQRMPIRPVRIHDEGSVSPGRAISNITSASKASTQSLLQTPQSPASPGVASTGQMRVLVAEDDPVNSRIIKKRLEKLTHDVFLTMNGEECASAYCERSRFFDIVLMDMQVRLDRSRCVRHGACSADDLDRCPLWTVSLPPR
jgi:light-regulated signal transduction histidine kinase (bacteriophytochrome)